MKLIIEFTRKLIKELLLKRLFNLGYRYLVREKDGFLYAYYTKPVKYESAGFWDLYTHLYSERVYKDYFPEVKWSDEKPTVIYDLLKNKE